MKFVTKLALTLTLLFTVGIQAGEIAAVLAPNSEARFVFNTKIVGLTESRIQSYWAQMRFSGRKKAPLEFDSVESLLIYVQNNKDTITYLPADTAIPEGLTIIYKSD